MLTREDATSSSRSPTSHRWTASSERWTPSGWNAGRDQIRTLDAITSERLDGPHWNLQAGTRFSVGTGKANRKQKKLLHVGLVLGTHYTELTKLSSN